MQREDHLEALACVTDSFPIDVKWRLLCLLRCSLLVPSRLPVCRQQRDDDEPCASGSGSPSGVIDEVARGCGWSDGRRLLGNQGGGGLVAAFSCNHHLSEGGAWADRFTRFRVVAGACYAVACGFGLGGLRGLSSRSHWLPGA